MTVTNKELVAKLHELIDNQNDQLAGLQFADDESEMNDIQYAYINIVRERLRQTIKSAQVVINAIGTYRNG